MPAISQTEARRVARARGDFLTQKDLMTRWQLSIRAVQRQRKEFGLQPIDCLGNNPLFALEHVEAVEELRREKFLLRTKARASTARRQIGGVITLKQIRAKAKRTKKHIAKQHAKGLS